jgi:hypothetical protein
MFRLIKSLVLNIEKLTIAIHQQTDAVRRETQDKEKATEQQAKQQPSVGSVSVEFHKPIAVAIEGEAKARIKNTWDWRDWLRLVAEALGLIVLICYARTTYKQWETMKSQMADFEASQRAILDLDVTWDSQNEQMTYTLSNIGRSIALGVNMDGGASSGIVTDPVRHPAWPSAFYVDIIKSSIHPVHSSPLGLSIAEGATKAIPSGTVHVDDDVKTGKRYLYWYVNIGFQDILGNEGHTYAFLYYDSRLGHRTFDRKYITN